MNPRAVGIIIFLMFSTFMLFLAGVAWWWVGLIVFMFYMMYAIT